MKPLSLLLFNVVLEALATKSEQKKKTPKKRNTKDFTKTTQSDQ